MVQGPSIFLTRRANKVGIKLFFARRFYNSDWKSELRKESEIELNFLAYLPFKKGGKRI